MMLRAAVYALLLTVLGCETEEPTHEPATPPAPEQTTAPTPAPDPAPAAATAAVWLNLNTASEADFKTVPEVGDRMAHEFEEYRPYISIQQFRKEMSKYVSAEQIAAYEHYVYVPIDPDKSDAATLQQIPGLTEEEAATLIAARPFTDQQAFLAALTPLVDDGVPQKAQSMLAAP